MNLEKTAREYFANFEQKNLDALSDMFAEEVTLKDWNIYAEGKESVLTVNENIFDSIEEIKVAVENLYVVGSTVVAELSICADTEAVLPVVDIITFNPDTRKIQSIVAYRGN